MLDINSFILFQVYLSLAISFICFYFYRQHQKKHLLIWSLFWFVDAFRLVFDFLSHLNTIVPTYVTISFQFTSLLSTLILIFAINTMLNIPTKKIILYLFGAIGLLLLLSNYLSAFYRSFYPLTDHLAVWVFYYHLVTTVLKLIVATSILVMGIELLNTDNHAKKKLKNINQHLHKIIEDYRALYAAIDSGILIINTKGDITSANLYAEQILELTEQELLKLNIFDPVWQITFEDGTPMAADETAPWQTIENRQGIRNFIMGFNTPKTNKHKWIQVSTMYYLNEKGIVKGAVVTFMDITALKEMERKQTQQKNNLQAILDTAKAIVVNTDFNGNINFINLYGNQITGYNGEVTKGMNIAMLEKKPGVLKEFCKEILNGNSTSMVIAIRAKDGTEITVNWYGSQIQESDGFAKSILLIGYDITELRQTQNLLYQSQKMEALGRLAGGVAHDYNNLLTGIQNNISLALADTAMSLETRTVLYEAQQAAKISTNITSQLLDFSSSSMKVLKPININDCVLKALVFLKGSIRPNITVKQKLCTDIWMINGNETQLIQVIMNLVLNSLDAIHQEGTIEIITENVSKTNRDQNDYVNIKVHDTGCGITPEVLKRIYEPFFTTKNKQRGTGLGLSVVYGIIQQYHGWIECKSDPQVGGTCFDILLPRYHSAVIEEDNATNTSAKTILLVDDDQMVTNSTRRLLVHFGYNVLTAGDALEALNIYKLFKTDIDTVILDITMPGINGLDTLKMLRIISPNVKVILASGYSKGSFDKELRLTKSTSFIQKPYSAKQLIQCINDIK